MLRRKYSPLCFDDPGDNTGASVLFLLEARCRDGGGGGGFAECRFVVESILCTEGGLVDVR